MQKFKFKKSSLLQEKDIFKECQNKFGVYIWGIHEPNNNFIPIYVGQAGGKIKNEFKNSSTSIASRLNKHIHFIDNYNILKKDEIKNKNTILETDYEVKKMNRIMFENYSSKFAYINFQWDYKTNKVIGGKNSIKLSKTTSPDLMNTLNHIKSNFRFQYIDIEYDKLIQEGKSIQEIKQIILDLEKYVTNEYINKGEKLIGMTLGKIKNEYVIII
jgi:hypothetical protein